TTTTETTTSTPTTTTPTTTTETTTSTPTPTTTTIPTTTTTETTTSSPTPTTTTTSIPTTTSTPTPTTSTPTTTTTTTETATSTPTPTPTTASIPTTTTETTTSTSTPTTMTLTTTTETTTSTPTATPTKTVVTTSTQESTTQCFCVVNGDQYFPGQIIYNGTDKDGWCFIAFCNDACYVEKHVTPCPTTSTTTETTPTRTTTTTSTPTTTTTSTPTTTTTSMPSTTPKTKWCEFDPPRKENETWLLCNCTMATCVENNTIKIEPVKCPPVEKINCTNGLKPVVVYDDDGCCYHYECDCYCLGFGDPHYTTFDGLAYTYLGNCTYVLVEEINKTLDNFGVYIDNVDCVGWDGVSCPRSIIVSYDTQVVKLKNNGIIGGPIQSQILVNDKEFALPFERYGVKAFTSGINMVVEIPEIKSTIVFNGLSFAVSLPYKLFGKNTQGQCGYCSNNQLDDCMLPNGQISSSCADMADHWVVYDSRKPYCMEPSQRPTIQPPRVTLPHWTTLQKCTPSPVCEVLKDSIFAKCREKLSVDRYYDSCVFDGCHMPNTNIECGGIQSYAALCLAEGFCVDWRDKTNGKCNITCPPTKIYKPCGITDQPVCQSSSDDDKKNQTDRRVLMEGCYCPQGTLLLSHGSDLCVKNCGCLGPDGKPREFGEKFEFNCEDCVCDKLKESIICEPQKCPTKPEVACDEEGFVLVNETNPDDACCTEIICRCNMSMCTIKPQQCPLGFKQTSKIPDGACCPVFDCVPKGVCVFQNMEFPPGVFVPKDICQNCTCTNQVDSATKLHNISCEVLPCNTQCKLGYKYVQKPGECCGKCMQTHCILSFADGKVTLQDKEQWTKPGNNCTIYECTKVQSEFLTIKSEISCPRFNEKNCQPGTTITTNNGCCKKCNFLGVENNYCKIRRIKTNIVHGNCVSTEEVEVGVCEGACAAYSEYSNKGLVDHRCTCCQEKDHYLKPVILQCSNGTYFSHQYTYVNSCTCAQVDCMVSKGRHKRSLMSWGKTLEDN
uniref:Mucin 2, oligomeric mucus/gel-forming n=1 Tax=Latimeria chalumnae TaxID=7897 RepID=H2ZTW6_LATCH